MKTHFIIEEQWPPTEPTSWRPANVDEYEAKSTALVQLDDTHIHNPTIPHRLVKVVGVVVKTLKPRKTK